MGKRKHSLAIIALLIFVFSLATVIMPVKPQIPKVKIYVNQPLGYLPFVAPGTRFTFTIDIATSGIADGTAAGIVQWKMDIRVNPNVLDINTTLGPVPPFPAPYAAKFSAGPGHFLYQFAAGMGYPAPSLFLGTNDPLTGYQDEISEVGIPDYSLGGGDYFSGLYPKLLTVEITSKSDTQGCLIDLIDVWYRTGDGVWHTDAVVEDGYYGTTPPIYMSYMGGLLPAGDPTSTDWHELYPIYSNEWHLTSWVDNGDGDLSASDQIDMTQMVGPEVGWIYWYHVDAVTTTIHWTFKTGPLYPDDLTGDVGSAEPVEPHFLEEPMTDPIGTIWHQIYPDYSREFVITSWEDNGEVAGVFDPSDQFDFEYIDDPGVTVWAHLDEVTTDIILSFKEKEEPTPEFPLGISLLMLIAPIIPLTYLWRLRKKVTKQ